jgi:hypothetical protein
MAAESDDVRSRVRQVLLNDWDPHGAARSPAASGAYDLYIGPLCELLRSGADEDAVVSYLHERELESMCFPSLGTRRLQPVARKLLEIREAASWPTQPRGEGAEAPESRGKKGSEVP